MLFKLIRIFGSNIFSFDSFVEGLKKGGKETVKNIFFIFLFLYIIGAFGFVYVITMSSTYKYLVSIGEVGLFPTIAMIMAMMVILVFGFTSIATNYYTGNGEEQFLSLPLTPTQFFGAKFAVSFITDAIIGLVLFIVAAVVYGYHEHLLLNPMFYAGLLVSDLAYCLLGIAIIYTLIILLLLAFPVLRKKSLMSGIASFFIIIFVFIFSLENSKASMLTTEDYFTSSGTPLISMGSAISESAPFLSFFAKAMNGQILPILALLAISAVIIFVLIPALGKLYVKTLNGFADIKTKKMNEKQVTKVLQKDLQSASVLKAFFWRDVKTVFREPTFFANGPLLVFLMPVILVVSFGIGFISASHGSVSAMLSEISKPISKISPEKLVSIKYYIVLGFAAFGTFMGTSPNIASTSFSREGKGFYNLKAMPVQNVIIVKAKFWHAFSYVVLSAIMNIILMTFLKVILKFPVTSAELLKMFLMMFCVMSAISISLIFIEMFIDTAHPKLVWENPAAAFKQNMNSVISVFISLIIAILAGVLGVLLLPKNDIGFCILTVVFAIISAVIGSAYFRYAEKRISVM